jgi:hypothetical protein
MTSLDKRKSRLAFTTSETIRYRGRARRIVVECDPTGYSADIRLEGTRQRFPISFGGIWNQAVKIHVEKQRAERKAARKERSR